MGRRTNFAFWTLLLLMWSAPLHCQEAPTTRPPTELKKLTLEQLFELEVTSVSKKPEALSKTAAAVQVVTQEDLRRRGSTSLPEALRYIPGVEVARVDTRQYAITARGFNGTVANKLLVLIDGRSVYTPLFSGVFWDAQDVMLEDVEQIEVIRGPGATVWGANAVNGVINVISKGAAQTQGLYVFGGGGNEERGFGGARYGGTIGSHGFYRVYGKHVERDASKLRNGRDAGDAYRMAQGGLRLDWTAGSDALTFQGDDYHGSVDQPASNATDIRGGNAMGRWTRSFSATSNLEGRVYYDRTERTIPAVFGETLDTYDVTLQHRFAPAQRHDLIWGLGYRRTNDDVRNSPLLAFLPAQLSQDLYTGFIQDEWTLAPDRLLVTLGSKFEHNDYSGFEIQPSGRVSWTLTPTRTVWGAVSRAVRAPSRIDRELYSPAKPPFVLAGGPGFKSEELVAFEVGYKAQPAAAVSMSLATFYNRYDRLRSLEVGPPAVLANGLEGHTDGIEAATSYQVLKGVRLEGGYTFLELDLRAKPGSTDLTQLRQAGDSPRHQWFARSSMDLPHEIDADVSVRFVDELPNQQVPAYTACDARLGWRPIASLELALVGQNLFDARHAEFGLPATRREIERSVYAKATWGR